MPQPPSTLKMGLQYSKSDATSAETSLPALPEDVIERIVSFITDTSHLQALSLASQAFNAHVKRLCPICIPLPCRDPKQTAEAVRRQARDPQGTCLRICAAWPSAPAATISRQEAARRVALCHTQCCIVLGRPVVQAALQHITTLELKVRKSRTHTLCWQPRTTVQVASAVSRRSRLSLL